MTPLKVFSANLHLGVLALTVVGLLSAQGCALTAGSPLAPADKSIGTFPPQPVSPQSKVDEAAVPKPAVKPPATTHHIGKASWYGPGLTGKKTASGEIFDDGKFTAAHKSLPLGSTAKVTNLSNGKLVKVAINDRGPFAGNRIIDLSRAAARAIGMVDDGVVQVRIDPLTSDGMEVGSVD